MLLQNVTRNNQYPYRRLGSTATNTETGLAMSHHGTGGPRQFQRFMAFSKGAGFPSGYNPGIYMPLRHSWMSSQQEAEISVSATANGLMGFPIVGESSFSFATSAAAELIAFGIGSASFAITTNTPAMSGVINGSGSAAFSLSCDGNTLGALADLIGESGFSFSTSADILPEDDTPPYRTASASFSFSVSADILPEDDTSPARTGSASMSFYGSLIPYAIGHMEGTTNVQTELTAGSIASAVWNSSASEFNEIGTLGNKLNTASSGGVDMDALAQAVLAEFNANTIPVDIKKINSYTITGAGIDGNKWRPA